MEPDSQPGQTAPPLQGAACAFHPEVAATGTCDRCGTFLCFTDRKRLHGRTFCPPCSQRQDVNYLETFRLKYWGKRDTWAYLAGVGALLNVASGGSALLFGGEDAWIFGVSALGLAAVLGSFFLGLPWARRAVLFVPLLPGVVMGVVILGAKLFAKPEVASAIIQDVFANLIGYVFWSVIPLLFAIQLQFDTRNQLFFKLPVPERRLRAAWNLYANNTLARRGLILGVIGLFVPGVAVLGALCSLVGLRRVDPDALPPVGRKGQAIAGLVISVLGTLGWTWMLLSANLR